MPDQDSWRSIQGVRRHGVQVAISDDYIKVCDGVGRWELVPYNLAGLTLPGAI